MHRATSTASAPSFRAFTAGLLANAAGLMAFLNPTINAYRRIQPDSLAPTHANWGCDNRSTFVRIPPERGDATRIEIRVADGAANRIWRSRQRCPPGRTACGRACARRLPSIVMHTAPTAS